MKSISSDDNFYESVRQPASKIVDRLLEEVAYANPDPQAEAERIYDLDEAATLIEKKLDDGKDVHQNDMDKAHKRWQKGGDLENKPRKDFYAALQDPERLAVMVGHLTENGGVSQWIGNGYADDSLDALLEYCKKWKAKYPAYAQLETLLDDLKSAAFDGDDPAESLDAWINRDKKGEIEQAIYDENWSDLYDLLDGTDLDERKFDNACDEEFGNCIEVGAEEQPDGKFTASVKLNVPGTAVSQQGMIELWSEAGFATEDAAFEAADGYESSFDEADEAAQEAIKDKVKQDLIEEYSKYGDEDGAENVLEQMDDRYSTFNDALLADTEKLLRAEFPHSDWEKAVAALKQAWGTTKAKVAGAVKAVTEPVRKFAGRVGKAASAAKDAFTKQESLAIRREASLLAERLLLEAHNEDVITHVAGVVIHWLRARARDQEDDPSETYGYHPWVSRATVTREGDRVVMAADGEVRIEVAISVSGSSVILRLTTGSETETGVFKINDVMRTDLLEDEALVMFLEDYAWGALGDC